MHRVSRIPSAGRLRGLRTRAPRHGDLRRRQPPRSGSQQQRFLVGALVGKRTREREGTNRQLREKRVSESRVSRGREERELKEGDFFSFEDYELR